MLVICVCGDIDYFVSLCHRVLKGLGRILGCALLLMGYDDAVVLH